MRAAGVEPGACFLPASLETRLLAMARTQAAKVAFTVLAAGLIPLALAEWTCRLLTDIHVLKYHRAIQTVDAAGA